MKGGIDSVIKTEGILITTLCQFHWKSITPSETVFSEEVDHVVVPTSSGKIDVLPNHVPIIDMIGSRRH